MRQHPFGADVWVNNGHVLGRVPPLTDAVILILTGVLAAFLNTAASRGSAVGLPIMIMIGVGPVMANASNRLPIVIGCATAVWTFHRAGHLPWRDAVRFAIPVAIGAVAGASLASVSDDMRTNLVIVAVVVALLLLFANPPRPEALVAHPSRGTSTAAQHLSGMTGSSGRVTSGSSRPYIRETSLGTWLNLASTHTPASVRHRPTPPATARPPAR